MYLENYGSLGKGTLLFYTKSFLFERRKSNLNFCNSLNQLIDFATSSPILAYPNYDEEFYIHTDASQKGLGCILYQVQDGKKRVITYGSRSLVPAEKNYHSTKLEFLALKWAICEKFRDFVAYANHFTVYTDNNPLLYIMSNTKLDANGQRWVSELSEFNFTIKYRPGIINRDPDCLSRLPLDIAKYQVLCSEEVTPEVFQEKLSGVTKSRTTPYHPQTNGTCERMNRTLLQMMRTLEKKEKLKWHEKLNKLTFAYNCTQHETTGYSPYFLMVGREPSIFLDRLIGKEAQTERKTYDQYVNDWKNQMQEAYEIAFQRASKKKAADRRRQLEKTCLTPLQRGDGVLLKNVKERRGPGKLRSFWYVGYTGSKTSKAQSTLSSTKRTLLKSLALLIAT